MDLEQYVADFVQPSIQSCKTPAWYKNTNGVAHFQSLHWVCHPQVSDKIVLHGSVGSYEANYFSTCWKTDPYFDRIISPGCPSYRRGVIVALRVNGVKNQVIGVLKWRDVSEEETWNPAFMSFYTFEQTHKTAFLFAGLYGIDWEQMSFIARTVYSKQNLIYNRKNRHKWPVVVLWHVNIQPNRFSIRGAHEKTLDYYHQIMKERTLLEEDFTSNAFIVPSR